MKAVLSPKIEVFNPYKQPFASADDLDKQVRSIVNPEVMEFMRSGHKGLRIVAKCTPCQCCACR
jgi:hypothetical protein